MTGNFFGGIIYAIVAIVALTLFASHADAQTGDRLPAKLAGHWNVLAANGKTFVDAVSISIDGNGAPGPVKGRVSWRGVTCGSLDEPFEGTWDGSVLKFDAALRPDVNVQRNGGQCGDGKVSYELRRKPGDRGFEGETHMASTSGKAAMSLSPRD